MNNTQTNTTYWMLVTLPEGDSILTTDITPSMRDLVKKLETAGIKLSSAQPNSEYKYNGKVNNAFIDRMIQIGQKDMCISFHKDYTGEERIYYNTIGFEKDTISKASIVEYK